MYDEQSKQFVSDLRKKAESLVSAGHVSSDIKEIIKDFLSVADNFENVLAQSVGHTADSRVLKKKLEKANAELNQMRKALVGITGEIKIIGIESGLILKSPTSAIDSANQIKSSIQKIAETVVRLTSASAQS